MNTELLKTAQSIAIVLPKNLSDEVIGVALALFLFFKKEHRAPIIFSEAKVPQSWKCLDLTVFETLGVSTAEHALIIDTAKHPIEEIRYEKDATKNLIKIILTTRNALKQNDITIESPNLLIDSIITVGAKNIEAIGSVWQKHPELFYEKSVVPVYVNTDQETLAEKSLELMKSLSDSPYTQDIATALLFSLFAETDSLKKLKALPHASELASELLAHHANHRTVADAFAKEPSMNLLQLWGRACVRSKIDRDLPVFWSVLIAEDFTKTNTSGDALPFVIQQMKKATALPAMSVFLWQHPKAKTIHPILASENVSLMSRVKPEAEYPTFIAAEEHIRKLLGEVL